MDHDDYTLFPSGAGGADLFRLVQTALISSIKLQAKQADGQSAKRYCSKEGALSVPLSAPAPVLH